MTESLLRPEDRTLVVTVRSRLSEVRAALQRAGASAESLATVEQAARQLDEIFLLVVVGEFNAGKSAFINALLGGRVLREGVTPTTARITLIGYGETTATTPEAQWDVVTAPLEFLRDLRLVDTPGTNAVIREHETITAEFVPRSDLVLFITSADRPFTESERAFLAAVREWGKKVVVVVNKMDLLETPQERQEVLEFVREHGGRLLGSRPEVLAVSARAAQRAGAAVSDAWTASGFAALERFLHERLDRRERLRLKLSNPVEVGLTLTNRYLDVVNGRLELLAEDRQLLADVERQLEIYRTDLRRQLELRLGEVDHALLSMESRGDRFFDEMLRVGRVFDLLNRSRVEASFLEEVVADAPAQIERRVTELIDWMVSAELRQWQSVTGHLAERRRHYRDRIVGDPEVAVLHQERERLIDSVGREAQRVVDSYDRQREAAGMADTARQAVTAAAAAGAGAVGLGTAVTMVATTAAADVTGILLAGVMATVGLLVIPAKRRRAKADLHAKVAGLRNTLAGALRDQFEREAGRSAERMAESVAPYSRFVRAESEALTGAQGDLTRIRAELTGLRSRIQSQS